MSEEEYISHSQHRSQRTLQRRYRVAAQGHLYAQPLIYGLEHEPEVRLDIGSPPSMADRLLCCEVDAGLLPSIDLQTSEGLILVPAGCVASHGRALTTRIFSRVRPAKLTAIYVDGESHSSVALAQVLWSHCFGVRLDVLSFDAANQEAPDDADGVLLIGDRVVNASPLGYDWQIDLGALWFETTGLPFVSAVWATAEGADAPDLYRILSAARRDGQSHLADIARQHAAEFGWPEDLAVQYITKQLLFEFGDAEREGLEEFFTLAADYGITDEYMPVRMYKPKGTRDQGPGQRT